MPYFTLVRNLINDLNILLINDFMRAIPVRIDSINIKLVILAKEIFYFS